MALLQTQEPNDDLRVVKPADHPVWKQRAQLLKPFLEAPRSWGELIVWGVENGMTLAQIQNTLAWMSFHDEATCTLVEPVAWSLVERCVTPAAEAPKKCSTCGGFIRSSGSIFWCALCGRPAEAAETAEGT